MIKNKDHRFRFAQTLHQLLPRLDRLMRQIDREAGATGAQLSALAAISEAGTDRLHLLAAHEGVSKPTMSRIVSALSSKGWLQRTANPSDERTPVLTVSKSGRDVLERCCAARTEALRGVLDGVDQKTCRELNKAFALISSSLK